MLYPSFVYGSNVSQSPLADLERCMNWYPEQMDAPGAPWPSALYPTPGQQAFVTVSDVGTRGLFAINGRAHGVVGGGIHELFANQTTIRRGSVAQDNYPAQLVTNGLIGNQLLVSSGTNGYLVDLTTGAVTQVLTGDCTMVGMIDTYFLAFNILTSTFRWSNVNDGLTWSSLNKQARTIAPDPWRAMVVDAHRQIWLIGEQTGEVWYDTGDFTQPFAPIPGVVFGAGTTAPFSVKVVGDKVMWLSTTSNGAGMVVSGRGAAVDRVSTHAVETAIAGYARTAMITDAEAFVIQDQGHLCYVLTFPSANATHVLDTTTGVWHDRGTWNTAQNRYDSWSPRVHAYAFGQHLVGARGTGLIASLDVTFGTEADGSAIRRLRIPPALWRDPNVRRMSVSRFQLIVEPGLGTSGTGGSAGGGYFPPAYFPPAYFAGLSGAAASSGTTSDPRVMLRTSVNAKTWSNERTASAGAMGRYGTQVVWTRCGSSDALWVPEITVSDPIPWRVMGAEIQGQGFRQQQKAAA